MTTTVFGVRTGRRRPRRSREMGPPGLRARVGSATSSRTFFASSGAMRSRARRKSFGSISSSGLVTPITLLVRTSLFPNVADKPGLHRVQNGEKIRPLVLSEREPTLDEYR